MKNSEAILLFAAAALSAAAASEEVITLESTVIGSQEQPKVLYIIPWKQGDSFQRLDGVLSQTISDVFKHQEYSELQREIQMLQDSQQTKDD